MLRLLTPRVRILIAGLLAVAAGAAIVAALAVSQGATTYAYVAYAGEIVSLPHNQLLVTDFGTLDRTGGQVLITDFHDRLLWKYRGKLVNPHSAYPTSNGNILISDTGDNRVIEVNRESRIVWDSDNLGSGGGRLGQGRLSDGTRLNYPNDAKLLPGGRIMISCRLQNRVVEISREGRVVRDVRGLLNRQHNPDLLPDGNLLIADSGFNRVIEVDRENRVRWQFGSAHTYQLSWPRDANLLPNGNILITDSDHNRLVEVNRRHQFVEYWTDLQRPYSASSLANGDILTGDGPGPGMVELNHHNHIIWRLNHTLNQYLDVANAHVVNGGFEDAVSGSRSLLSAWHRDDALAYSLQPPHRVTMVRDCTVHRMGRCSGRITYQGDSNGVYFSQMVAVVPGATYAFSGWIKTRHVVACHPCVYGPQSRPGHTAEYELYLTPGEGAYPVSPVVNHHSGTTGWTEDAVTFTIPGNIHMLEVDGYLRGQGTVWFDGVTLRRIG